jgi:excisionase family DNA binding protein
VSDLAQTIQDAISSHLEVFKRDLLVELRQHVLRPQLVTFDEAAKSLGVSRATIYGLVESGELPSVRIGRARRIPVFALKAYVERKVREHEKAV